MTQLYRIMAAVMVAVFGRFFAAPVAAAQGKGGKPGKGGNFNFRRASFASFALRAFRTMRTLGAMVCLSAIVGISSPAFAKSQEDILGDRGINTNLHNAIRNKDDNAVRNLINKRVDLEARTLKGETALHLAVLYKPEYVPWLLDAGANPDATDNNRWTPLHYAAGEGKLKALRYLITAGADVDARINIGWTPIHTIIGIRGGNSEDSLRSLIREGADFDAEDRYGITPLRMEEKRGDRNSPLARILRDEVRDLVNQRYHLQGWNALFHAVKRGNPAAVETIIIQGGDVHIRAYSDKAESVLHIAALYSPHIVPLLVNARADINARDNNGWTPLHYAAAEGYLDGVSALFRGRADPNIRNNIGTTPLHLAIVSDPLKSVKGSQKYNFKVVQALIYEGANVKERDNNAWTPLHYAAAAGRVDAINAILDAGADINARNNKGWTPVHAAIAVARNDTEGALRALIKRGADMHIDSEEGKPLQFANDKHGDFHPIAKIIREATKAQRR